MRVIELHTASEKANFAERYSAHAGAAISENMPEYLKSSEVRAMIDEEGQVVGGYLLAPLHVARCIGLLPDDAQNDIRARTADERVCELNMVWLDKSLRHSAASARLWMHIAANLGRRRDIDRIVYATVSSKKGLVRLYTKITVGTLYEGPLHPRHASATYAYVYWSTPSRFRRLPFLYAGGISKRLMDSAYRHIVGVRDAAKAAFGALASRGAIGGASIESGPDRGA